MNQYLGKYQGKKYWNNVKVRNNVMAYRSKLQVSVEGDCIPLIDDIFEKLNINYDITYCGVHEVNHHIIIFIQNKNKMSSNVVKVLLQDILQVIDVKPYTEPVGEVLSKRGEIKNKGGVCGKRKSYTRKPSNQGDLRDILIDALMKTTHLPRTKEPSNPTEPPTSPVQTPTNLPNPSRKVSNSLTILDSVHYRTISVPTDPNAFHAIWSSENGLWFPVMWVGPVRNIFPVPRGNIRPHVIQDLLEEQESKCRLCSTDVFRGTYNNSDVDHIIPLKYGGSCHKGNLQVLCVTCHRRKSALERKKLVAIMGSDNVTWLDDMVYMTNTHVYYEVQNIPRSNPHDAMEVLGSGPGLFILDC